MTKVSKTFYIEINEGKKEGRANISTSFKGSEKELSIFIKKMKARYLKMKMRPKIKICDSLELKINSLGSVIHYD